MMPVKSFKGAWPTQGRDHVKWVDEWGTMHDGDTDIDSDADANVVKSFKGAWPTQGRDNVKWVDEWGTMHDGDTDIESDTEYSNLGELPGGYSAEIVNKILSLVAIAENGDTNWKNYYNYCQDIGDNRGYTISIVGFCTGTGDFIQVLQELEKINRNHPLVKFIPLVQGKQQSDIKGLERLPHALQQTGNNDQEFNEAVWKIIRKLYWNPSFRFCQSHSLYSALAFYIVYDTMLNFGELDTFEKIKASNECEFLSKFLDIKQAAIVRDPTLGDAKHNRVDMQKSLLKQGKMDLQGQLHVECYKDKYVLS